MHWLKYIYIPNGVYQGAVYNIDKICHGHMGTFMYQLKFQSYTAPYLYNFQHIFAIINFTRFRLLHIIYFL